MARTSLAYPSEVKEAALDAYRGAGQGARTVAGLRAAKALGADVPVSRIMQWASEDRLARGEAQPPRVRATPTRRFNDYLRIDEDCLILPDLHIPYQDSQWVNRCIEAAISMGIKHCFLPGDVIDANWASAWGDNAAEGMDDEIKAWAEDVEPALLASFDKVYWTLGNHEFRISRISSHRTPTESWIKNLFGRRDDQVVFSEYHWGLVRNVWVGHPKSAGRLAHLHVARVKGADAVLGHTHHFHASQTEDGKHFGWQIGWCGDASKTRYINVQAPHGQQAYVNGAAIIKQFPGLPKPTILPMIAGAIEPEVYIALAG